MTVYVCCFGCVRFGFVYTTIWLHALYYIQYIRTHWFCLWKIRSFIDTARSPSPSLSLSMLQAKSSSPSSLLLPLLSSSSSHSFVTMVRMHIHTNTYTRPVYTQQNIHIITHTFVTHPKCLCIQVPLFRHQRHLFGEYLGSQSAWCILGHMNRIHHSINIAM